MDFLAIIMSIVGLISCSVIYILITNVSLSWKYLLAVLVPVEIVLIGLNILFSNINMLQYNDVTYLVLLLGFLLAGIYSLKISTRHNKLYENTVTSVGSELKNILKPVPILLLLFIPLSILQISYDQVSIYLTTAITALVFAIIFFIAKKTKSKNYHVWEILGIINIVTSLYLIFSLFLPGDYSFRAKLFTPGNSGVNALYIILLAVVFIIIFSIGFFAKPKKTRKQK